MSDIRWFKQAAEGRPCILALGTFDGVHRGHSALIGNTLRLAESLGMSAGAFFFKLPPASYFSDNFPGVLTDAEERFGLFAESGLDFACGADFEEYRDISADDFIQKVLIDSFGCAGVVCGFNYSFGAGAAGKPEMLKSAFGENFICMPPYTVVGVTVSSSGIRALIAGGDAEAAAELTGRPYSFEAEVIDGRHDGRKLGFPTVNQLLPAGKVMPAAGVYASVVTLPDGREYYGVTDAGRAPSMCDGRGIIFETHILDFSGNLYGKRLRLSLCARIRDEKKFDSLGELVKQIKKDTEFTERYFSGK